MQTLPLTTKDLAALKRGFNAQVQRLHVLPQAVHQEQTVEEVVPDVIVGPNDKVTWLNQMREELDQWIVDEKDIRSHKRMRETSTEAKAIKYDIEEELTTKIVASQEAVM